MPLKHRFRSIALGCICLLAAPRAWADGCTASTSAASFGVYDPFNPSPTTTTATVTVTCQALIQLLVGYTISLSSGSSGSVSARTMTSGTATMPYQLYLNPSYSTVWGDGSNGSQTRFDGYLLAVITPVVNNYTVYARIPAQLNLAPATYNDTVVVLVTY